MSDILAISDIGDVLGCYKTLEEASARCGIEYPRAYNSVYHKTKVGNLYLVREDESWQIFDRIKQNLCLIIDVRSGSILSICPDTRCAAKKIGTTVKDAGEIKKKKRIRLRKAIVGSCDEIEEMVRKYKSIATVQVDPRNVTEIKVWDRAMHAADALDLNQDSIYRCLKNALGRYSAGGFYWCTLEEWEKRCADS